LLQAEHATQGSTKPSGQRVLFGYAGSVVGVPQAGPTEARPPQRYWRRMAGAKAASTTATVIK